MTKVKICGITNLEDALLSVEFGADMLGFNFYEKSPRYLTPEFAREITSKLPDDILKIGVFVNKDAVAIAEVVNAVSLDAVQLHGDEDIQFVDDLKGRTNIQIIKAFRVAPNFEPKTIKEYGVDGVLLDAYVDDLFGGTGETLDIGTVQMIKQSISDFYLAGGLTPENIGEVVRTIDPFAVDVASGVEMAPGKKDPRKVEAFIKNAKNA